MHRTDEIPKVERLLCRALAFLLLGACLAVPVWAAGGSTEQPAKDEPTPAEQAKSLYNQALEHRDAAWALEEKGGSEAKLESQFTQAVQKLEQAVDLDPQLYQAWSSLGYAQRRLGNYEASLDAYDTALEIAPTYAEAVEYRAEAYLALGRLDEAKEAHVWLSNHDAERADELLLAMREWLENESWKSMDDAPDAATVDSFRRWVGERGEMADTTAFLRPSSDGAAGDWGAVGHGD